MPTSAVLTAAMTLRSPKRVMTGTCRATWWTTSRTRGAASRTSSWRGGRGDPIDPVRLSRWPVRRMGLESRPQDELGWPDRGTQGRRRHVTDITRHEPGSFSWVELATTDTAAAKKFYGALFGW